MTPLKNMLKHAQARKELGDQLNAYKYIEDRPEIILDKDGEPIGPNDKVVSDLSYSLGTIARRKNFEIFF